MNPSEGSLESTIESLRPVAQDIAARIDAAIQKLVRQELRNVLSATPDTNVVTQPSTKRRGRPPKAVSAGTPCSVPGCTRPARSKGLCAADYQKQLRKRAAKSAEKSSTTKRGPGRPPKAAKATKAKRGAKKAPEAAPESAPAA